MIAYAITDPKTLHFTTLQRDLEHFSKHASMIVYRDKATLDYEKNAIHFLSQAKKFDKVLLHSDYLLAKKLGADGVHLKSTQFEDVSKAKNLGLFVVISTHTQEEVKKAEILGADMVTFSPVFSTPNKGLPAGIDRLKNVIDSVAIPVIALGGILTQEQIDACVKVKAKGFASIRYFERNSLSSL